MTDKAGTILRSLVLLISGSVLAFYFNRIADISFEFEQDTIGSDRPIVLVLSWFWFAFAAYLVAWAAVGGFGRLRRQSVQDFKVYDLLIVFAFAIAFRMLMVTSTPIQEIDLYRYVWDGAVVSSHLDPYQFGPKTVFDALQDERLVDARPGLEEYTRIVEQRPGLYGILDIVHFGQYTSPYPPTSQMVFGLAVSTVKPDAEPRQYLIAMKVALVIFDLLTGLLVAMLLYHVGMNPVLSLGYLWCPLVLKEIANGGHLDSIATFFAVLAFYLAARALWVRPVADDKAEPKDNDRTPPLSVLSSAASAIALGAAFAAKVFPIVLAPVWFVVLLRRCGVSAIFSAVLLVAAAYAFSLPMLKHIDAAKRWNLVAEQESEFGVADPAGIEAFSKYWEMNDFLFMMAVENLKPTPGDAIDRSRHPWFVFTSNDFRNQTINRTRGYFEDASDPNRIQHKPNHFAFFLTRSITLAIFCLIVAWSCFVLLLKPDRVVWLEMAFLTLAWFWLLSPTQNPWYWTWSIPLLVFARSRCWVFLSGILFAYYLRFWFEYQFTGVDVMSYWKTTLGESWVQHWLFPLSDQYAYQSKRFFDMYVPVLEFGPFLFLLMLCSVVGYVTRRGTR